LLPGRRAAWSSVAIPAAMVRPMNARAPVERPRHEFLWVDIFKESLQRR
jgi:hypothetical protein